ncbi:hypothetical protein ACGC1H_000026 [Rhizoctonia solani]
MCKFSQKQGVQSGFQSAAEGMHNLPKVYSGEVRKHKKVTGIGLGFVQGGREFVLGLYDGFSDFFYGACKGIQAEGCIGSNWWSRHRRCAYKSPHLE